MQLRPIEVGLLQLRLLEVHTAQNRTLQIKLAVGATQPLDVSRCPAAQIEPSAGGPPGQRVAGATGPFAFSSSVAFSSLTYPSPTRYIGPTITGSPPPPPRRQRTFGWYATLGGAGFDGAGGEGSST